MPWHQGYKKLLLGKMLKHYVDHGQVGPVPVLVMSLLFIACVFMLHIWGKYNRCSGNYSETSSYIPVSLMVLLVSWPSFSGLKLWCQVNNVCIFSTGEVFQDFKFGSLNQLIRTMEDCNRSSLKHFCVFCRHCSITMTTKL